MERSLDRKTQPHSPEEINDAVHAALLAVLQGEKPSEEVKVIVDENRDSAQRIAMKILTEAGMGKTHEEWLEENNIYV